MWGLLSPFWEKIGNQGSSVVRCPWLALSSLLASSVLFCISYGMSFSCWCFCFVPGIPLLLAWVGGLVFCAWAFGAPDANELDELKRTMGKLIN